MLNMKALFCFKCEDQGSVLSYSMVSIEDLKRVWYANRGRLLLLTPGPNPLCDLHMYWC